MCYFLDNKPQLTHNVGICLYAPNVNDAKDVQQTQESASAPNVTDTTYAQQNTVGTSVPAEDHHEGDKEDNIQVPDAILQESIVLNKRKNRKWKPTRKKLKYVSSSDDDIPLSFFVNVPTQHYSSGSDSSFIPKSKDLNSSDTEYNSDVSATSKKQK